MRKMRAVLGSALFFVAAPCVTAGVILWWITGWKPHPAFLGFELIRALGVMLILLGVPGIVDAFARFALQGLSTPALVAPPQHLVVTGLYRYVRNPMYVAVIIIVIGQVFLFGDWHRMVIARCSGWLSTSSLWHTKSRYCCELSVRSIQANVPRWIPRGTPWERA